MTGELLESIKEAWQFNMTELAELLGVTRPTVYSWKNGKTSPSVEQVTHLQTLAAAGSLWKTVVDGTGQDYLLDYTGPMANETTIRERLKDRTVTMYELCELIPTMIKQYRDAREQVQKIIGEPPSRPLASVPEESWRLNELWASYSPARSSSKLGSTRTRLDFSC